MGAKSREARAIFHRLAGQGWVCASANYRLREAGRFPNSLIDAKKAIAWARRHAPDYDADPTVLVVAGSSAECTWPQWPRLHPTTPHFSLGLRTRTPPSAPPSASTAITATAISTGRWPRRRWRTRTPTRPRSSLRTAPTTPPRLSRPPQTSPNNCEASPPARSSMRSCPARGTSLTCFARCGWNRSSTGSRSLPAGSVTVVERLGQAGQLIPFAEVEHRLCRQPPTLRSPERRSAPLPLSRKSRDLSGSVVADPCCSGRRPARAAAPTRWLRGRQTVILSEPAFPVEQERHGPDAGARGLPRLG